MGLPDIDYVKAMDAACRSCFSANDNLKKHKRLFLAFFAVSLVMFTFSVFSLLQSSNKTTSEIISKNEAKRVEHPQLNKILYKGAYTHISASSGTDLVNKLQEHNLWEQPLPDQVPAIILDRYPREINKLPLDEKKKAFLHSLLPIALTALSEVAEERRQLLMILDKFTTSPAWFNTDKTNPPPAWFKPLTSSEIKFIEKLAEKYRTTSVSGLLSRVNTVPPSLILAQGAIESSWGGSRFASKGNNLFGIWTWGNVGMVPAARDDGKKHLLATYDSLLDSVRAYILMLNRVNAYTQLRTIRKRSNDPVALAAGLLNYSERGGVYVSDIGRIIEYNNLRDFDNLTLVSASVKTARAESIVTRAGFAAGLGNLFSN